MDIIATIGPTLETFNDISKAVLKGVNTFRLGLGYRSRDTISLIKTIKEVEIKIKQKIFIMIDLPSSRPRISNDVRINIKKDDILFIKNTEQINNKDDISINNFSDTFQNIEINDIVTFLDGKLKFTIKSLDNNTIKLMCISGEETLKQSNSLTVINRTKSYKLIVDEDIKFFNKLNKENLTVDWIAFSFSENKSQIIDAKNQLLKCNLFYTPRIIAKIETKEAVYQLNNIALVVDGFMVARGDLAVNLDFKPLVAETQKQIIEICHKNNLYSIVATELLENFVDNGVLSRSEISDLSLSISQLPSALQLGKETVYSQRPFQAIDILKEFIDYEIYRQEIYKVNLPKRVNNKYNNLIVAIEGANGAGKSTLCKALANHFNTSIKFGIPDIFLQKDLKEKMIIDAHWYSSSLFFISGAIEQIKEFRKNKNKIIISDRSIWSTLSVQTSENPKRLKSLIDISFNLENVDIEPDITIILRANYKTCRERISYKSKDEQMLDELINSKEFYQKEDQFYNWLTFQRDNIINIDVNDITELDLSNNIIDIINARLEDMKI